MEFSGTFGKIIRLTGANLYDMFDSAVYANYPKPDNQINSFRINGESGLYFALPKLNQRDNSIIYYNTVNYSLITGLKYIDFPSVSGFSPSSGTWGDIIKVSGAEFIELNGVSVGNIASRDFRASGENNLFFTIPDDATSGFISISTTGGLVVSSGQLRVSVPPVTFLEFSPLQAAYGAEIFIRGRSLGGVNQIKLSGILGSIDLNEGNFLSLGSTGIIFNVPFGTLHDKPIRLIRNGYINQGGSIIPTGLENAYSVSKLGITGLSVIKLSKTTGRYQDYIDISGTALLGKSFLFKGYGTGDSINYIPGLSYNYVNDNLARVQVPKNIVRGSILVSGSENDLFSSFDSFTPYPTIHSFVGGTVGSLYKIQAINATEIFEVLAITGLNKYNEYNGIEMLANKEFSAATSSQNDYQDYFGSFDLNYSGLNSNYPTGTQTGFLLITGILNNSFIGLGYPFLISKHDLPDVFDLGVFEDLSAFNQYFPSLSVYSMGNMTELMHESLRVNVKTPIISGFAERLSRSGKLEISGKYLMSLTGFSLNGIGEVRTVKYADFKADAFGTFVTTYARGNENVNAYESFQSIRIMVEDFGFTGKSGTLDVMYISPS